MFVSMVCVRARREKIPEEMHTKMVMTQGSIRRTKKFKVNTEEQQNETFPSKLKRTTTPCLQTQPTESEMGHSQDG